MTSIVRDGNHFINFNDGTGWILIDGPWYDRLVLLPPEHIFYLTKERGPSPSFVIKPSAYIDVDFKILKWQKIPWCPGLPRGMDVVLRYKYDELLKKFRYKTGWRVHPDGKLPVLFNAIEWDDDMRFEI